MFSSYSPEVTSPSCKAKLSPSMPSLNNQESLSTHEGHTLLRIKPYSAKLQDDFATISEEPKEDHSKVGGLNTNTTLLLLYLPTNMGDMIQAAQ